VLKEATHRLERTGWLRAAVLGANDGIVSTASLIVGVAAASGSEGSVLVAGVAGLVAGAMSMATGEYVSVHSQKDLERAALDQERAELKADAEGEHKELAAIYVRRGLDASLAKQVAEQLMAHDALGAHARDELGISKATTAKPLQAALASAGSFAAGGVLPLLVAIFARQHVIAYVAGAALLSLVLSAELVYAYRGDLAQRYPVLRPYLESVCAAAGCTISWAHEDALLKLEDSELLEVPGKPNEIALGARIRNLAQVAQEYPYLELTLTDLTGQAAIRRVLRPTDYLGRPVNAGETIAPGAELSVQLRLETPRIKATGYELLLFYP